MTDLDVLIVGAGPAGMAAAIEAARAGLRYVVLERGALVDTILRYPTNMVFFTTPDLLEIGELPFVTPHEKPTRFEALRYYRRVADAYRLVIELGHDVQRITPSDTDAGFAVESRRVRDGSQATWRARYVIVAVGAFDCPNRLDVPGEDLPHVSHYYSESHPYYRRRVVVVGGKNSAADAALDLYRNGAHVTLVHRRDRLGDSIKYWVKPDIENRIKEGAIAAHFDTRLTAIGEESVTVEGPAGRQVLPADHVLLLTGYRSDVSFFEAAGVRYDAGSCAPVLDPSTMESSVPGLFIIGSAITGRQSGQIFIENGRFHGRQVVRLLAERLGRPPSTSAWPAPAP